MKVALVHDWLNSKRGGAEKVLLTLAGMYPDAPIYTLLYDEKNYPQLKNRVTSSFLQKYPKFMRTRPRYLMPLIPSAVESFDLSGFDVIISSSTAYSKNIITSPDTLHISYCHSPARLYWDYWPKYIKEQRVGLFRAGMIRGGATLVRLWDHSGTDRVDVMVANSKTTQRRIKKYYRRDSEVLYPPVETQDFKPLDPSKKDDYYVMLSVLTPYKKIDLAIEAFNVSGKRLIIISDGPDRKRLEAMAESNISFTGYVSDVRRAELLAKASGLLYPNEEDFGIVPVESMASGTPVIAFKKGGLTETVIEGKTGVFFEEQTVAGLNAAIAKLESLTLKEADLTARAAEFNVDVFKKKFSDLVEKAYQDHVKTNQ